MVTLKRRNLEVEPTLSTRYHTLSLNECCTMVDTVSKRASILPHNGIRARATESAWSVSTLVLKARMLACQLHSINSTDFGHRPYIVLFYRPY